MGTAYILHFVVSFFCGIAGGVFFSYTLGRRIRSLEIEMAELSAKVVRETKSRAADIRWNKPKSNRNDVEDLLQMAGNHSAILTPDQIVSKFHGR